MQSDRSPGFTVVNQKQRQQQTMMLLLYPERDVVERYEISTLESKRLRKVKSGTSDNENRDAWNHHTGMPSYLYIQDTHWH